MTRMNRMFGGQAWIVATGAVAALTLAGCTASSQGGGSRADAPTTSTGSSAPRTSSAAPRSSSAAPAASVTIGPVTMAMNPTTPIVARIVGGKLSRVAVTNTVSGVRVTGAFHQGGTSWSSSEPLGYGKAYRVSVAAVDSAGKPQQRTRVLRTLKPRAQAFPSLIPPPSVQDVGVGQPIVVRFDHPVTNKIAVQKRLQVRAAPAQSGAWYWISASEVHYRPATYWKPGTTVNLQVRVYGVDIGGGVYGETDRELTFRVHDAWVAKADGAAKTMQIVRNGALVKTMPISLGTTKNPTHIGTHVISERSPWVIMDSSTFGVAKGQPGYYREKVYLDERISNDGEFVHAAPWSTGSQGLSNVSHGCVNLSVANAQWFYAHFNLGDVVEVTNSGGDTLPLYDTYGDWAVPWSAWSMGNANS